MQDVRDAFSWLMRGWVLGWDLTLWCLALSEMLIVPAQGPSMFGSLDVPPATRLGLGHLSNDFNIDHATRTFQAPRTT